MAVSDETPEQLEVPGFREHLNNMRFSQPQRAVPTPVSPTRPQHLSDQFSDHPLQLFHTAGQLMKMINVSNDQNHGESLPEMWDRKVEESKVSREENQWAPGSGVYNSLTRRGWDWHPRNKIRILNDQRHGQTFIVDGHHRVAAANAIDPNMAISTDEYDIGNPASPKPPSPVIPKYDPNTSVV